MNTGGKNWQRNLMIETDKRELKKHQTLVNHAKKFGAGLAGNDCLSYIT